MLFDDKAIQKEIAMQKEIYSYDERNVPTPLFVEIVVYAHWQTSPDTVPVPARSKLQHKTAKDAAENAAEKPAEAENNAVEARKAEASTAMEPCFLVATIKMKCDFSFRRGLCGEFSLMSVTFD